MPILIVEDDPNDQDLIKMALARAGISNPVVVAQDGQEALDKLVSASAMSPLPALVLLDLKLPKVNGFEVLAQLRSHEPTRYLPVVVMSSSSEQEDMTRSYESGANSYIRKPVAIKDYNEAIKSIVNYWLNLNQSAT
jgi:two-component system response regulator